MWYNINMIKNIFTRKTDKPKERIVYAVTKGTYLGTCLIFVKPNEHPKDGIYAAMAIGDKDGKFDGGMDVMQIPEDALNDGLKTGLLDKVSKVPKELYNLCCSEYDERLKRKNEKIAEDIRDKEDESTD